MTDANTSAAAARAPGNPQPGDASSTGTATGTAARSPVSQSSASQSPVSQAPAAPPAPPQRHSPLPSRPVLLLGVTLALVATDPTRLAVRGPVGWLLTAAAVVAA